MFDVLSNEKAINSLAEENPSLLRNVLKRIKSFIEDIKAIIAQLGEQWAEVKALSKDLQALESIRWLMESALSQIDTTSQTEKNTVTGDGVKYSLTEYSEHQKNNWKNSKKIVLYDNESQFREFIQNSLTDTLFYKKIYFGAVSKDLADLIKKTTGYDVEGYNCSLSSYEIRKIFKDHGNEEKENLRGQRAVTIDDILYMPTVIQSPTKITLSDKEYENKPVINFIKKTNEQMTVSAVVSDKHLDLFIQTAFVNIKKESLATPIGEQAPINTPEANGGTASNNRISQKESAVNTHSMQESEKDSHKFSYAGRRAKTANLARLEEAMRLDDVGKATAEEIRQQTGWFRGYDGKWRFEIDDSKMQFSRSGDIRLMQDPDYQRLAELSDNYKNLNKDERKELLALEEQFEDDIWNDDKLLIDYVSHPELFEAYPQLKTVNLTFANLKYSRKGYFDPRTNTIVLNSVTPSEWEKTIIHELQHAIQRIEGFASGANKEVWTERMKQLGFDNPNADRISYLYNRTAGEIEAQDAANRIDYNAEQRNNTRPDIDSEDVTFVNDLHKNGNNDDIKYSLKSVDKKQQKEYNDIRKNRKRASYNENETLFMQWQHGNNASVGDTRAFIRLDKKLHFYEKTEDGCIEITQKEFDERKRKRYEQGYESVRGRIDVLSDKYGAVAKRRSDKLNDVYGYSGDDSGNDSSVERSGFQNDQQGNLERSRGDSEEASEIKLSLQSTDAAAQERKKLINQNKNLRVANMLLKQELVQTHGKMLTYDGAKALAKEMVSNYINMKIFYFYT